MSGMKISELDMVKLIPSFMRNDEAVQALCQAVNKLMKESCERVPTIRTWDQFDKLSEAECDEMAWEQDIDWYDSSAELSEKRRIIEYAQQIKRRRGTKWAVEQLVSAYFGTGYVLEWFEEPLLTDGPFSFCVMTDAEISEENYSRFISAAQTAKNERSHLSGIYYYWFQGPERIEITHTQKEYVYNFSRICGTYPIPGTVGIADKHAVTSSSDVFAVTYNLKKSGTSVCGTYPERAVKGSAEKHDSSVSADINFWNYKYPRCGTKRCGQ